MLVRAQRHRIEAARFIERALVARGEGALVMCLVLDRNDRIEAIARSSSHHRTQREIEGLIEPALTAADCWTLAQCDEVWVLCPGLADLAQAQRRAHTLAEALGAAGRSSGPAAAATYLRAEHVSQARELLLETSRHARRSERAMRVTDSFDHHGIQVPIHPGHAPAAVVATGPTPAPLLRPQVCLDSSTCRIVEAWLPEAAGPGSPERSTTHSGVTEVVLERLLPRLTTWGPVDLVFRASEPSLRQSGWFTRLQQACRRHRITPNRLTIEFGACLLERRAEAASQAIPALRRAGFRVRLGDFGIRGTSLAWLREHRVDDVRIDRLFSERIDEDGAALDLLKGLVALTHATGARAICDGIDRLTQMEALKSSGCDDGLGLAWSPPLSAAALGPWLANRSPVHRLANRSR